MQGKNSTHNFHKIWFTLIIVCAVAFAVFLFVQRSLFSGYTQKKEDLQRLSEETYNSVLLSMHSVNSFSEEDFAYYLALDTIVTSYAIKNTKELAEYLDCIAASGNDLSMLYLCLEPGLLWESVGENSSKWSRNLTRDLYSFIETHPDITFDILLPYPYIDYWRNLDSKELDTLLTVYHTLINELAAFSNAITFFLGHEEWMMMNPDHYVDGPFEISQEIAFNVFAGTFCGDGRYQITPANEETFWNSLRHILEREKDTPTIYPDLSDWCLVLFGDSVLGNFSGSTSIPGYINGLSHAFVYNFAIGGTSAASRSREEGNDLPDLFGRFVKENITISEQGNTFTPEGTVSTELEGKKLCFLFNYGFNDYYSGVPIENSQNPEDLATYTGSLRTCIHALQIMFPDAYYVIMTPTHTKLFSYGMEALTAEGSVLPSYIDAAEELASEMNLYFLDNYYDFVITKDTIDFYLSDGTHPNERGRFVIAARLIEFIDGISR